ncbi:MAG: hypothetical protein AAFW67_06235 [Cyanobacteria bacterium J06638_38]
MLLTTLTPVEHKQVVAQTVLSCSLTAGNQNQINNAIADYNQSNQTSLSNQIRTSSNGDSNIEITNLGIANEAGEIVNALGIVASGLLGFYQQLGLSSEEANKATLDTLATWAELPPETYSATVIATIKQSLIEKLGSEKTELITQISESQLLTALAGLTSTSLKTLGLSTTEIATATQTEITPQAEGSFIAQIQSVIATIAADFTRPEAQANITSLQENLVSELEQIRQGNQTQVKSGSILSFRFLLDNQSDRPARIELPNIQTITETGLVGSGKVTRVTYGFPGSESQTLTDTAQTVTIPGEQTLNLSIQVEVGTVAADSISNLGIDLQTNCGDRNLIQETNLVPAIIPDEDDDGLIDPRGQISGCSGEILADYLGFSVALYDVNSSDPTASEPAGLTPLTTTELPDDPDNEIPEGIEPNTENSNPFFLTNSDEGQYSFLFDEEKGQLDKGRSYILVVDPGANSTYDQRQVKLTIGDRQERIVEYTATSLDGKPISAENGDTTITGQIILVEDAERIGLNLAVLDLATDICDAEEISLTKTGDRAAAEPGDIVLYRLSVQNLASTPLTNFQITDTLPPGFALHDETVLGEANSALVEIDINSSSERVVNFTSNTTLEQGQTLTLVYAAEISPDALRGDADNSAIVNAQRTDNNQTVKDGPAIYSLQLESGIIRDAGTIIGRVFVDHNFDGEQQTGEPGIPNAVIYLENGNRIITDADGLFSVSNVLPGYHTGILDLTSIPEYKLAPNLRFIERNSKSRLINLEPGGLVRMNFGVTPTATGQEEDSQAQAPSEAAETSDPNQ